MKPGCHLALIGLGLLVFQIILSSVSLGASFDVANVVNNITQGEKQNVLVGKIDSLIIKRGNAEFILGAGDVSLYDFASGRIAALTFIGNGRFVYHPPDDIEKGQLRKFTKQDSLDDIFRNAVFFFTVELDQLPDTTNFSRTIVDKNSWAMLEDAQKVAFDRLGLYLPNSIIGDLLATGPGTFFYGDFDLQNNGHMMFCEDPLTDDVFRLYRSSHNIDGPKADIINGYSPDHDLVSQRGVLPIDITHYAINSKIEGSGKMMVNCQIAFIPMRWGRQFLYFNWFSENKILSAVNWHGDSLKVAHKKDEPGFGIVLNQPLEPGQPDTISIAYQCKSLDNLWGVYYISSSGHTFWYPWNSITDPATYELTYDCPKEYQVISVGDSIDGHVEGDRRITKWSTPKAVNFASFNIGIFDSKTITVPDLPPVKVYLSKAIPHNEIALLLASQGELSSSDMLGRVGADVTNSMVFYTSLFGPCPFSSIKVTEIPMSHGQGPPGLIHLSWATFQTESMAGTDEQFRAHETAHQWWGHVTDNESYRDTWIIEGLSEYCGFWFYQMSSKNMGNCKATLNTWKQFITTGAGANSVGSKAGPIILGDRLFSSKSNDYGVLVYEKGAYIFHMIRYILHDYKTNSDDAFAGFLKALATKYDGKIITTPLLQKLLEEYVGEDVSWFFNQWVYGTEIPTYHFNYTSAKTPEEKYKVTCHIKQEKVSPGFQMMVPVTVLFDDDRYVNLKVWVDQPEMDIDLPTLPFKPKKIIFNSFDAVLCNVINE